MNGVAGGAATMAAQIAQASANAAISTSGPMRLTSHANG